MTKTVKRKNRLVLEPIICDVKTPFKRWSFEEKNHPQAGDASFSLDKANNIKMIFFATAEYLQIKLPYRFALVSGEIVYENKHIKSLRLSGSYLSGIDPIKAEAQLSIWKTEQPPETSLDEEEGIVMSDGFSQRCYFVAHRGGEEFHIEWNLAENYDICLNPQNYPGTDWQIIDFTK